MSTNSPQTRRWPNQSTSSLAGTPARRTAWPDADSPDRTIRMWRIASSPSLTRFALALSFGRTPRRIASPSGLGSDFDPVWKLLATRFCPSDSDVAALGLTTGGSGCSCSQSKLPTLTARTYGVNRGGESPDGPGRPSLRLLGNQGLLPTLTVKGNYARTEDGGKSGDGLSTALARLSLKGPLHPCWCEAFMGFPVGWTAPGGSRH